MDRLIIISPRWGSIGGACYHDVIPAGLHLRFMPPLRGCFRDKCHPYGVRLVSIMNLLSSYHPCGIYFLVNTSYDFQDGSIYPTILYIILHAKICMWLPAINCISSQTLDSSLRKSKTRGAGFGWSISVAYEVIDFLTRVVFSIKTRIFVVKGKNEY